ncbi:hypothetical protein Ddye_007146 [Dipteronia dyeriana]|uniref:Peptidase C1A papain C-terminal domain-containing protein n=1 Tax=Dipteronia dyeriana TaxID=168575 RepID=A0AAE0CRV5_9ROSI|nr:hypothetical protein Ddye_007146 [Dipteronia dyeriana]
MGSVQLNFNKTGPSAIWPAMYSHIIDMAGACWAFAAVGAMEGINKIVTGSLFSLSAQELIECDISHNNGCEGGFMDNAYQFVIDNHGINTEDEYPYLDRQRDCNKDFMKRRYVTIDGYTDVPANNETLLLQAVAAQPVSAGICASDRDFQFYRWHAGNATTGGMLGGWSSFVEDQIGHLQLPTLSKMKSRYVTIDGYTDVPANNQTLLLQAVAAQPVSAVICASERDFQFYHRVGPNTLFHCAMFKMFGS